MTLKRRHDWFIAFVCLVCFAISLLLAGLLVLVHS